MYSNRGILETNPAMGWFIIILVLAIVVLMIASMWKIFTKAGKPGWAAIVPIYNVIVLCEIAGKPIWMGIVMIFAGIIPVVGIIGQLVLSFIVYLAVAEKFGKSQGFGVGMVLLPFVFMPMLAFGDAQYEGATVLEDDQLLDV